jgi:hypothetical protein
MASCLIISTMQADIKLRAVVEAADEQQNLRAEIERLQPD